MLLLPPATINFSRLGARAFISKTAKASAKVYFKSTVAGLHPDDQAAGQRVPAVTATACHVPAPPAAGRTPSGLVTASSGTAQAAPAAQHANPYPVGSSAAAAAMQPSPM